MKITNVDQNQLLLDLDAQRKAMNLSYQNVADACDVSQATIMRIFKRQTEPTFDLLQKIAASVHYDAKPAPVMLEGYTKEEYSLILQHLEAKSLISIDRSSATAAYIASDISASFQL